MSETIKIPTKKLREIIQTSTLTTSKEKDNILSNTIIKIKGKIMEVSSKNSTTQSKQIIEIEDTNEVTTLLINPNTLSNILKELQEETTYITISENTIKIQNGKFKTLIKTINKELYPDETPIEKEFIGTIEFNKLKHLMKSTIPYPDKNDISREYTGIFIEINDGILKATSTDHFRLMNVITNIENKDINENFIIENEGGVLISKIDMEDKVELYKNKHTIELKDKEKTIESKIIQGEFPNYEAILLSEEDNNISLNREELLLSIRRVSITNTNNEIELMSDKENSTLHISSKNQEGEESTDEIEIKNVNAENELKIKLNARFLIGFLSQVNTEDIELFYKSSDDPIMLKCEDETYIYNYIMTPMTG